MSDVIANMLTIIRNGINAKKQFVYVPKSNIKLKIANILLNRGYIQNVIIDKNTNAIKIFLKYRNGISVLNGLKRVSKPGKRIYVNADKIPQVLNNLGDSIISTSKGVMTGYYAKIKHCGGELLAFVW